MNVQREALEQDYKEHIEAADESVAADSTMSLQGQALEALAPNRELGHNQPEFGYGAEIKIILKTGDLATGKHMHDRWLPGGVVVKTYRDDGSEREQYLGHTFIPYENIQSIHYKSPFPAAPSPSELTEAEARGLN